MTDEKQIYLDLCKEVQELKYIDNFFQDDENQKSNEFSDLEAKIVNVQNLSRKICINSFSFETNYPISSEIKKEDILKTYSAPPKLINKLISNSNYMEIMKNIFHAAHRSPTDFADITYSYLQKNPQNIPIFSHLIVPSIFGYFISDEQLSNAFDYLIQLFTLGEYDFSKPFLLTFLSYSILFLDIFWNNLYNQIVSRHKPSLLQLHNYLLKSINSSISYLSSFHIQILISVYCQSPSNFCDLFFDNFLLNSFPVFNKNSKITENEIKMLFNYIKGYCETDLFIPIYEVLTKQAFSFNEQISFEKYNQFIYILSPYESLLLFKCISPSQNDDTEEQNAKFIKELENDLKNEFNNFEPGIFIFEKFNDKNPKNKLGDSLNKNDLEEENLIFEEILDPQQILGFEKSRLFRQLLRETKQCNCDIFKFIKESHQMNELDTIKILRLKFKYQKLLTLQNKVKLLRHYRDYLLKKGNDFELFLKNEYLINQLKNIENRSQKFLLKQEKQFSKHFASCKTSENSTDSFECFAFHKVLSSIKCDEAYEVVRKHKRTFARIILDFNIEDSRLINFFSSTEKSFSSLKRKIDHLDEIETGEKLLVFNEIIASLDSVCKNESDVWPIYIFLKLFDQSTIEYLLETVVTVTRYEKLNPESFDKVTEKIKTCKRLFSFILFQVSGFSLPDDESETEKSNLDSIKQALFPIAT